jgi:S1-C subfamily serine protease
LTRAGVRRSPLIVAAFLGAATVWTVNGDPFSAARESAELPPWFVRPVREVLGSGIVIDAQGLALTNAHVVERAGRISADRRGRRPGATGALFALSARLIGIITAIIGCAW